jgi:ABC-type nitrate/sulfonate/bicarbonate transport system substrate-binding protein
VIVATAGTAFAQQPRELTIGLPSRSLVAAPPRIAKELGLFDNYGLNPRFVVLDSANAATGALISKSVDVAISGLVEVVAAQARGQKVVVIANSYTGLSGSLVLSKAAADKLAVSPNAPVAQRLKALDGLLIASTSATSSFTIAYRGAAQATGANVRFTYMGLPAMGAALDSGAIQGFVATAPYWTVPVLKGSGVLWISAPKGELPPENSTASGANYQMMRDFAEKNPDLVKKFVMVMNDLSRAIESRPNEVKAAIAKLYPDLDSATIDLLYRLESPAWKTKPLTAQDVAHEIRFLNSGGVQLPDADKLDLNSMLLSS